MLKTEVLKKFIGAENTYKLKKKHYMKKLNKTTPELIKTWSNNSKFEGTHKGERCFILGNGPSLKDVCLKDLQDEFVFSVNNFSMVENYKDAKTDVHLWIDYSFFDLRYDQKYDMDVIMDNYKKISEENPICFVPHEAYEFIKKNKLDEILDINYLFVGRDINEGVKKVDISEWVYTGTTVVQYAIQIAIYMGFTEIYLLGCDTTNIVSLINVVLEQQNSEMHAYKNDDTEERYKGLMEKWKMTDVFYDQYILFLGYKNLNEYCKTNNIKLYNCSSKTLINEIERIPLPQALK